MSSRLMLLVDQAPLSDLLRVHFEDMPHVTVAGTACTTADGIAQAAALNPDVVLVHVLDDRGAGAAIVRQLRARHCPARVGLLVHRHDDAAFLAAMQAGARAYIPVDRGLAYLEIAVRTLATGGAMIPPHLTRLLLDALHRVTPASVPAPEPSLLARLTPRERQIIGCIGTGAEDKQIADRLGMSTGTVKVHIRNIYEKLHFRNRQRLAVLAVQEGLVARADDDLVDEQYAMSA